MAKFYTYAEVLTPDHFAMKAYAAGISKNPPGLLLRDVLRDTGGVYALTYDLPGPFREDMRKVAELTSDKELLSIADRGKVTVSLEHFHDANPETTWIVCGYGLDYTLEESNQLGLGRKDKDPGSYDPRITVIIDNT